MKLVMSPFQKWKTLFILLGFIYPGLGAWLRCYKGSPDTYVEVPLGDPLELMPTACIDPNLPLLIYTFGYRGKSTGPATVAVIGAYIATKKKNVMLLNWEEEAKSGILGLPLGYMLYAVPNAKRIGYELGNSIIKLARSGLNMTQIHLVGHSLGAHLMGYAGRRAREMGYTVSRITGLDPARALYEGSLSLQNGLDRTCARFVDIYHTDPGGYGSSRATGTVDFWLNYAGGASTQPGCPGGDFQMFSQEDLCSHDRSWKYFVEAIRAPTSFVAIHSNTHKQWTLGNKNSSVTIYLGELTNRRARGNFYLTTNYESPFSKGVRGLDPVTRTARDHKSTTLSKLLKYFS